MKRAVLIAGILLCAVANLSARNYHADVRPVSALLIWAGETEHTLSPGHALTFTLVIENRGKSAATDVRISSSAAIQDTVPERPQAYSQYTGPFPFEAREKTSTLPTILILSDSEVQNLKRASSRVYVWTEATWKDATGPRQEAFCNWLQLKFDSHGVIREVKLQKCNN
jgi:uncharacterized repeat protein (TIGR01451 family)